MKIMQGDSQEVSIELRHERNEEHGLIERMNKLLKHPSNCFSHLYNGD